MPRPRSNFLPLVRNEMLCCKIS
ncbi:hypothetical protein IEO21_03214 [Rhodonia placenta]|uniref:Uncharacterized protein n=1 Tax=Rhodonia placenta TaxID=104341 RepID=A0A8H7P682_9APHY|nr:hypothetical protein IEO21_03214 [Postia placenta]